MAGNQKHDRDKKTWPRTRMAADNMADKRNMAGKNLKEQKHG